MPCRLPDIKTMRVQFIPVLIISLLLGACASTAPSLTETPAASTPIGAVPASDPVKPVSAPRGGAFYKDDGPGDQPVDQLALTPDPIPSVEPFARGPNRPYTVFGRTYTPDVSGDPLVQEGVASWYGRRYHGRQTSSGEIYDMNALTAAHTTLPIPSYARVTRLDNGRQVLVRVNDRGPFLGERIIDLSYAAAARLGMVDAGQARVRVERLMPDEIARIRAGQGDVARASAPAPTQSESVSTAPLATPATLPAAPLPPLITATPTPSAPVPASTPAPSATPAVSSGFFLQAGAFGSEANAQRQLDALRATWPEQGEQRWQLWTDGRLWRVQFGPWAERGQADAARQELQSRAGNTNLLVVQR